MRSRLWGSVVGLALLGTACGRTEDPKPSTPAPSPAGAAAAGDALSDTAKLQIEGLLAEKEARTAGLRQVDSQLVYALKMRRGEAIAPGIERMETSVEVDTNGFVAVEIETSNVADVVAAVEKAGGKVLGSYPKFGGVNAHVPLTSLETLGALPTVKFVRELRAPMLHREDLPEVGKRTAARVPVKAGELAGGYLSRARAFEARGETPTVPRGLPPSRNALGAETQAVNQSAGVTVHRALAAQQQFDARGQGVRVGVLSDSVDFLASVQATGDLPAVTVLPGQGGSGSGEGTAMLEIVHDMAPSAELYFATAFTSAASFATNILGLGAAGCDVIVDDVMYFNESPFQDGPIAQAVNTVTAAGAIYLSSAGNSGSLLKNTSGAYEGNYAEGDAVTGGNMNLFSNGGAPVNNNQVIQANANAPITLHWSDALGLSANDYDLFIYNAALTTIVNASTNIQNGDDDPYEASGVAAATNQRVVVVKKTAAAPRFLHVSANRGRFAIATTGQTKGHSAAVDAISVAAAPAWTALGAGQPTGPYPAAYGPSQVLENFSSDGARRVFYNANGSLANTMNSSLLDDGGVVRQKPDITAADGVATATPGFNPFFGTSAAAPHAAGIVAQMLSVAPSATPAQIRAALTARAIDIEGAGTEINSGSGIVMSNGAVASLLDAPTLSLGTVAATPTNGTDATLDPGEAATLVIQLTNAASSIAATSIGATLSTTATGVTVTQGTSAYPDIAAGGSQQNTTPFAISLAPGVLCGLSLPFTLSVTSNGGAEQTFAFNLTTGTAGTPVIIPYAGGPVAIPDGTGADVPGAAVNATLAVGAQSGAIVDIDLRLTGTATSTDPASTTVGLNHSYVGDLVLSLTSPDGTSVRLVDRMGGGNQSGNNFYNTFLDDAATNPIETAGTNPFTGTFRPENPLAGFSGQNPAGTWTFTAQDFFTADVGSIRAFSLVITPAACNPLADIGTSCTTGDTCSTGHCIDGVCCDTECGGNVGDDCQACAPTGICGAAPAAVVCRAAAGECDVAETCGGATVCPADAQQAAGVACGAAASDLCDAQDTCNGSGACVAVVAAAGTQCRASGGVCDAAEVCTGMDTACPADVKVAAGTECRATGGVCDVAEACNGVANDCPVDGRVAAGTPCRGVAGLCDTAEACDGTAAACPADAAVPVGTPCGNAPSGVCDAQDVCAGTIGASATCVPTFQPPTTECRGSSGVCDVAESCTGSAPDCPTDGFVAAGSSCRASVGACDVAEACTGTGAACPADAGQPAGTACGGAPSGVCDAQDTCSGGVGASATCVANYLPSSTSCRAVAGACDVAESCSGAAPDCPADVVVSAGTTCRAAANVCDAVESCDGTLPTCGTDAAVATGTPCGGSPNGVCDAQDTCAGTVGASATCVANYQPSSTTCRPVAGDCDVAESCTGSATTCPTDGVLAQGALCRASVGACDAAETCNGTSNSCGADAGQPAGTPCGGAPSGVCDAQDTCSGGVGASASCVANYEPSSVTCRPTAGDCDLAESCTGNATACPADGFANAGTLCRDTAGVCDVSETCTGTAAACPANGFVSAGTTCRAAAGDCDVSEACTGSVAACPADVFVDAGTTCRAAVGPCDAAEACSGSGATCGADAAQAVGTPCGTAPSGVCDAQDTCAGTVGASAVCTANYQASSVTCRPAAGGCDVAENCSGNATTCPTDAFAPTSVTCSDQSACTAGDHCDGSGDCAPGTAVVCNDDNVCTADSCDPLQGCVTAPVADGASCSDDNACTAGDQCMSGTCQGGTPLDCDDDNVCTIDSCDTAMSCTHVNAPTTTDCDDGNACTVDDACNGSGTCAGGTPLDCDDDNECTADSCRTSSGCRHQARDGNVCAGGDGICVGTVCTTEPAGTGGVSGSGGGSATGGTSGDAGESATGGSGATGGSATGGSGGSGATGEGGDSATSGGEGGNAVGGQGGEGGEGTVRPPTPPVKTKSGCDCRVGPRSGTPAHGFLGLLLALGVLARRRARSGDRRAA